MKVTFIFPKWRGGLWNVRLFRMPPLGLLSIASATPKEWDIEFIDENVDEIKYSDTDLVAISAFTALANRAYEIADKYRAMGIKVIIGGVHASTLPQEAIQHADCVVIGEADLVWGNILSDFQNNKLKKFYEVREKPDLSKISPLRRELIKGKYFPLNQIQTSRGCPYGCDFCSVSKFNGIKIRNRPVQNVVNEILTLKKGIGKPLFFIDDNIVANPSYAEALFKAIKRLNINWASQASIGIARNEKLLSLAAESGCKALFIGFETLSQACLQEVHKAYNVQEYKKLIRRIHDYSITLEGAFMFGFDSDKKDVFKKTTTFCNEVNMDIVQLTALTPLPGTKIFERLKEANRIITYDWDYYDAAHVVFTPKKMSAQELRDGIQSCYDDFYSYRSIAKRMFALTKQKVDLQYLPLVVEANLNFRKLIIG